MKFDFAYNMLLCKKNESFCKNECIFIILYITNKEVNMKKITLSAVLSALFMMGCSDMGVDNSVASTTREIIDVQNQYSADFVPVLKKTDYYAYL